MLKRSICVRTRRAFLHCYPEAPDTVDYLRYPHRHLMHIELQMEVFHSDRELEFILVVSSLNTMIEHTPWSHITSCEQIAEKIIDWARDKYGERDMKVSVFEDGENGAIVEYTRTHYERED